MLSRYARVVKMDSGETLLFNPMNGALLCLSKADLDALECYIKEGKKKEHSNIIDSLIRCDFFINNEKNENKYLHSVFERRKNSTSSLGLTIIPYLGCNLDCKYCFVGKKSERITQDTCDGIVRLIEAKAGGLKKLSLTWMGGEPLIGKKAIASLSERIIEICHRERVAYHARILTNGLLLTEETAKILKACQVTLAQVSIDGSKYMQDVRRKAARGKDTYNIVMDNIASAVNYINIGLRVNIDKSNSDDIATLLDDLEKRGLKKKVVINFGQLVSFEGVCELVNDQCYTKREFSEVEVELYSQAINKGFFFGDFLFPSPMFCGALTKNSLTIDPGGAVHRCWNLIGRDENKVGHLYRDRIEFNSSDALWMDYNPYNNESCCKCDIFPLCSGGCPYNVLLGSTKQEKNCQPLKWNLDSIIKLTFESGGDIAAKST
jgi:uncharacterized protein